MEIKTTLWKKAITDKATQSVCRNTRGQKLNYVDGIVLFCADGETDAFHKLDDI